MIEKSSIVHMALDGLEAYPMHVEVAPSHYHLLRLLSALVLECAPGTLMRIADCLLKAAHFWQIPAHLMHHQVRQRMA